MSGHEGHEESDQRVTIFVLKDLIREVDALPDTGERYWSPKLDGSRVSLAHIKDFVVARLEDLAELVRSPGDTAERDLLRAQLLNSRDTYPLIEPIVRELFACRNPYLVARTYRLDLMDEVLGQLRSADGEYLVSIRHIEWNAVLLTNFGSLWVLYDKGQRSRDNEVIRFYKGKSKFQKEGVGLLVDALERLHLAYSEDRKSHADDIARFLAEDMEIMVRDLRKVNRPRTPAPVTVPVSPRPKPNEQACCVCYGDMSDRRVALDPCGHISTCGSCAPGMDRCPICRTPIRKVLRIYG